MKRILQGIGFVLLLSLYFGGMFQFAHELKVNSDRKEELIKLEREKLELEIKSLKDSIK
jgi:hypothetical protein